MRIELGGNGQKHPRTKIPPAPDTQQAATYSIAAVAGNWTILVLMFELVQMAGNVACAVHAAAQLGSYAFGMFIKFQHKLQSEPLGSEEVTAFRKALAVRNLYTGIWQLLAFHCLDMVIQSNVYIRRHYRGYVWGSYTLLAGGPFQQSVRQERPAVADKPARRLRNEAIFKYLEMWSISVIGTAHRS